MLVGRFPNATVNGLVDIATTALTPAKFGSAELGSKSLANLVCKLLSHAVDKRIDHRLWESSVLPRHYLEYAATDAYAHLLVFQVHLIAPSTIAR